MRGLSRRARRRRLTVLPALAALAAMAALSMPLPTLAAGCMEGAPDREALIQCSKYELVLPENRAGDAEQRLLQRHAADPAMLERLRQARRDWDARRDAQCVRETRAALAAPGAPPLEGDRAMLICLRREFARRAAELEAQLAAPAGSSADAPALQDSR